MTCTVLFSFLDKLRVILYFLWCPFILLLAGKNVYCAPLYIILLVLFSCFLFYFSLIIIASCIYTPFVFGLHFSWKELLGLLQPKGWWLQRKVFLFSAIKILPKRPCELSWVRSGGILGLCMCPLTPRGSWWKWFWREDEWKIVFPFCIILLFPG